MENEQKTRIFIRTIITAVLISSLFGAATGFWAGTLSGSDTDLAAWFKGALSGGELSGEEVKNAAAERRTVVTIDQESSIIGAVESASPAVVSIIVTKDLPIIERYYGAPPGSDFFRRFFGDDFDSFFGVPQTEERGTVRREIGGGTGFIVSADGYIITNRHVVEDQGAEYTVLMNDESRHEATVLAQDTLHDIAILKIEASGLPTVPLGDSTDLKVGQTVVAIGNSLGEFRNTVSVGVISGLARSVTAGGLGRPNELLLGVIQTDASINPGNSGGPLLNIAGQVIGINTAMAAGAENIGFAIPVNEIKNIYENVKTYGRIIRPWLGIRYVMINQTLKEDNNFTVDYGALIVRGEQMTDLAVIPGSPADKAGLRENDIILEFNNAKLDNLNPLANAISRLRPGDEVTLKILRQGEEQTLRATLEEMK